MQFIDNIRHPTVTAYGIYGFFGKYRFLSNFHPAPLKLEGIHADGLTYPTSEHAYMALKTQDMGTRMRIAALRTPRAAREEGQLIELRKDWDVFRPVAMLAALRAKFRQNPELADLLLATGLLYLEETNNWGDRYWGVVDGEGLSMLGKTLMQVRKELQESPELICRTSQLELL